MNEVVFYAAMFAVQSVALAIGISAWAFMLKRLEAILKQISTEAGLPDRGTAIRQIDMYVDAAGDTGNSSDRLAATWPELIPTEAEHA